MVIDAAGLDFLPESFADTAEKACRQFHEIDWDDIRQRELDVMSGRYHVRHVRLQILDAYAWPREEKIEGSEGSKS